MMRTLPLFGLGGLLVGCGVLISREEVNHPDPATTSGDTGSPPSPTPTPTLTSGDTGGQTTLPKGVVCPVPGKTAVIATVVSFSGPPLVPKDLVSFVSLDIITPVSFVSVAGDLVVPPHDLVALDFEPGTFNLSACLDRAPLNEMCEGKTDVSTFMFGGTYDLVADLVYTYDIDFDAVTLTETGSAPKDAACP